MSLDSFDSIGMVFIPFGAMCMMSSDFVEHRTDSISVVFVAMVSMCTEIKLKQIKYQFWLMLIC